jgi:hypothetical protein
MKIKCVCFFLQLLPEMFSCKVPVILVEFNEFCILSTDFREILTYDIPRKCVQWEPSCSTRTEKQTGGQT